MYIQNITLHKKISLKPLQTKYHMVNHANLILDLVGKQMQNIVKFMMNAGVKQIYRGKT
jgi:hypothetical protein